LPNLRQALPALPKAELHLHLRGAMPPAVLAELLNKYGVERALADAPARHLEAFRRYPNLRPFLTPRRWSPDEAQALFRYESFDNFLMSYCFTKYLFHEPDDLRLLLAHVLDGLRAQNIAYAEITVAAVAFWQSGIPYEDIKACLEEAAAATAPRVQWILDLCRDYTPEGCMATLREMIELRCSGLVGITLGGSEHLFPPSDFTEVYSVAREHGLRLTVHAGEALGPESVWDAIRLLGVERLGHGVRAIEDPALVEYLAEHRIPLEVCPTSNLRTGIYPSYEAHPLKALHDAGVPVTINSDDPTFFDTTLAQEYVHAYSLGLAPQDLFQILSNGFRYAFLPRQVAESHLSRLREAWAGLGLG